MEAPTFDHERLDVYRRSIEYAAFSYRIAKGLTGVHRPASTVRRTDYLNGLRSELWLAPATAIGYDVRITISRRFGGLTMDDRSRRPRSHRKRDWPDGEASAATIL